MTGVSEENTTLQHVWLFRAALQRVEEVSRCHILTTAQQIEHQKIPGISAQSDKVLRIYVAVAESNSIHSENVYVSSCIKILFTTPMLSFKLIQVLMGESPRKVTSSCSSALDQAGSGRRPAS